MKKIVLSIVVLFSMFVLFSCGQNSLSTTTTETEVTISSKEELISLLDSFQNFYGYSALEDSAVAPGAAEKSTSDENRDYSETNTQVKGVDEADIVKTDGTYIYMPVQNKVLISKVYPVNEMNLTQTITYEDGFYPNSLYVDDENLVVIGNHYQNQNGEYYWYYRQKTRIIIYDKTDYETPKDVIDIDGYVNTTRKVDDELLVISNRYVYYNPNDEDSLKLPEVSVNDTVYNIGYEDIHYQKDTYPNSFVSLLKFDLNSPDDFNQYTYLGSSDNVYVSHENVYIAQAIYHYWNFIMEEGPADNSDETEDEEKTTNETTTTQVEEEDYIKTIVTKINYSDDTFGQSKNVKVKGYVNNQFSMDEYDNTFRIATTRGMWWGEQSSNNLYIYDDNLELLSSIEGIAKGERIQSARFVGERIYIVTFRQIDPFFVIDVKDPRNPEILGELKIPGYSTYLHPYDENHIIGFGFDTRTENYNGREVTRITGIKMSMFNVEDPENPVDIFNEIMAFGENGYAYSELAYNHKAMLFNKNKNLIAFPFSFSSYSFDGEKYNYYYNQSYKVYQVDLENGFTYKTDISHFDTDKETGYHYGYQILRGVYIEENLYTVSYSKIEAHSLTTYEKLNMLDLGFDERNYYHWWYYPEADVAK